MSRIRITFLLALLLGTPLFAQQLTLQEALQSAQATNSIAQNAKITLEKQLNKANINSYLPSIDLSVGASASISLLDQESNALITPTASVSFSLSSSDRYTKASNTLLAKTAQTAFGTSIQNLKAQVTQTYWNVTAAELAYDQQLLDYEQKSISNAAIQAQFDNGKANTLAVSQAKLALFQAKLTVESRNNDFETAKQALQRLIGYEIEGTSDELMEVRDLKNLEFLQELSLSTTSIKQLSYQVEQAELALKKVRASSASPVVAMNASTSFSGSLSTSSSQIRDTTKVSVSVSFSLDPYLPNSSAQVTLENLQKDITLAKNTLEQGIKDIQQEVQTLYQSLLQIKANLEYLLEYQKVADETYNLTLASYEAGEVPYLTLQESEQQQQNVQLSILQQKVDYTVALYNLAYLLETDINTIINE
ncbi:TolC family protein [Sphaerochaeta globosa]|uniref:Outer membrane efflux protein n=1 Tax=Sphaerochaeta globosa (strain ATCC BAA-1886 / DSM 22777 / Buddy) TaxID=158189 RepID=F0RYL3_SPHGB|nr:TolC family protein [Sphaerochaeta globosa]ADY12856.1 outer membrane efflux protein [Sphaerochaeta globosa str. Buddy]